MALWLQCAQVKWLQYAQVVWLPHHRWLQLLGCCALVSELTDAQCGIWKSQVQCDTDRMLHISCSMVHRSQAATAMGATQMWCFGRCTCPHATGHESWHEWLHVPSDFHTH
jgi:hypothetical protein